MLEYDSTLVTIDFRHLLTFAIKLDELLVSAAFEFIEEMSAQSLGNRRHELLLLLSSDVRPTFSLVRDTPAVRLNKQFPHALSSARFMGAGDKPQECDLSKQHDNVVCLNRSHDQFLPAERIPFRLALLLVDHGLDKVVATLDSFITNDQISAVDQKTELANLILSELVFGADEKEADAAIGELVACDLLDFDLFFEVLIAGNRPALLSLMNKMFNLEKAEALTALANPHEFRMVLQEAFGVEAGAMAAFQLCRIIPFITGIWRSEGEASPWLRSELTEQLFAEEEAIA